MRPIEKYRRSFVAEPQGDREDTLLNILMEQIHGSLETIVNIVEGTHVRRGTKRPSSAPTGQEPLQARQKVQHRR